MSKPTIGARVQFCGHDGTFIADIFRVGDCNVVRASQKVTPSNLKRPADDATHLMVDFPVQGFWRPDLGVFVVPQDQVEEIAKVAV
jgi:hypothetical protein